MTPCSERDKCACPCGQDGQGQPVVKTRAELGVPCGFEMADAVGCCPRRRRMEGKSNALQGAE